MRDEKFEKLYEEHAARLLGYLVYRTGDRALAEDILADTFERLLRSRGRFDPRRGSVKTWIYSIALNRLRDQLRRREAEERAVERAAAGVEPVAPDPGSRDDLMQALAQLGDAEREAISLRYGADLTFPEVAKVIGTKLSTAEGRVYRGLEKLRKLLED